MTDLPECRAASKSGLDLDHKARRLPKPEKPAERIMGIEYRAATNLQDSIVVALLDDVAKCDAWSVVSRSEYEMVLRWAAHVGNDSPNDAAIEIAEDGVYLTIYAGVRGQRERLLRWMTGMLRANGLKTAFEEL
jgi:hypothetical protein